MSRAPVFAVSHLVRMDDYFRATRVCVQVHCKECEDACEYAGKCDSDCLQSCEGYYNATYDASGEYAGCAGPYDASDGGAYWLGPACATASAPWRPT